MLLARLDAGLLSTAVAPDQAIQVDFDATSLVAVVLFVALTLVLKPILFDPMLKLFEERERRIDGAKIEARRIDDRSTRALVTYEAEMAKARALANADRERIRAEGLKREQEILTQVRQAVGKTTEEGKRAALAEANRARAALHDQTTSLARDLAERVLGREVPQ